MSDDDGKQKGSVGTHPEKFLSTALLIVPCVAILSAGIYFAILSAMVEIIPLSFFNLQDYFDKAVDLLIPVFLTVGFANLVAAFVAGVFTEPNAEKPARREHPILALLQDWIPPLAFLFMAVFFAIVHPEKERWLAVFVGLLGTLFLTVRLAPYTLRRLADLSRMGWMPFWGLLMICIGLLAYIMNNVSSSLNEARDTNLRNGKAALVDNFSFGHLVIEAGRYRVKTNEGELLAEGSELARDSKSLACEWGWVWACQFTVTYGTQAKGGTS